MTDMTDLEKYRLLDKITKYIIWLLEICFFAVFIALAIAVHSKNKTINYQKYIIEQYEHNYRPVQQEQN